MRQATATSLEEGLKIEATAFGRLAVGDVSRALVSVFFATQDIKKDPGYPEGTPAREVGKLGVLGAGLMGAGIAGAASNAGAAVRMKDTTDEAVGRGLAYIREGLEERRKRRSLTPSRGGAPDGPGLRHRGLLRPRAGGPRDRGGVRGPRAQAPRAGGDRGGDRRRVRVREQHLVDPHRGDRPGLPAPGAGPGDALLLAGAQDAPPRDRGHARDPAGGPRHRRRLRAAASGST